jgi:anti-anti-sigma factor
MSTPPPSGSGPGGDTEAIVRCFEDIPAVVWLFEGPELTVVAANRAARASVGDRAGIIGRPVREVIPEMAGQQIFDMIAHCLGTGTLVIGRERRALVDRNGDGVLEEGFFTFTFTATHDSDGSVRGVLAHVLDVTDQVLARRSAEERATESERRYREARDVVATLQRHLLPQSLPALATVRLAAHYLVASSELAAGGDWFDAIPLDGGGLGLVVGDVVGHGPDAAATMSQLRTVAAQALHTRCGPALDEFARRHAGAHAATVCVAELDTDSGVLDYVLCGHPAPVVLSTTNDARVLPGGGPPLGVGSSERLPRREQLSPGDVLLMYTDGLVERADRPLADGIAALAEATRAAMVDQSTADSTLPDTRADLACTSAVERMGWLGYTDDVTVLAVERLAVPVRPLHCVLPAVPASLSETRRAIEQWLRSLDADDETVFTVQHAVGEAVTNAVEHAYGAEPGILEIHAEATDLGVAEISVVDQGAWREARIDPGARGRGLTIMRRLADSVEVRRSPQGTTVLLRFPVRCPVVFDEDRPLDGRASVSRDAFATAVHRSSEPRLDVRGPVDFHTEEQLRQAILEASRGGALPLVLDLTQVTYLASAGVRLLFDLNGIAIRSVVAPDRSPAGQVLAITGFPATAVTSTPT